MNKVFDVVERLLYSFMFLYRLSTLWTVRSHGWKKNLIKLISSCRNKWLRKKVAVT